MSPEKIQVQLGPYDQLEILREEQKLLGEQLAKVERSIRDILLEVERQKYLQSLSAHYRMLQQPEGVHRIEQLEQLRGSIQGAIVAIDQEFSKVDGSAGGAAQPKGQLSQLRQQAAQPQRPRPKGIQGFQDFKRKR